MTEQNPEKLGKTIQELDVKHAMASYPKTKFSMCIPQVLDYIKIAKEIDTIVLVGLETHICVEQTAMDLLSLEKFNIHICADGRYDVTK